MEGEIKCTQTHVITQMKKKKEKESHCKMGSSCGLAATVNCRWSRIYFVSPAGGEEPKRGDFGETYTR